MTRKNFYAMLIGTLIYCGSTAVLQAQSKDDSIDISIRKYMEENRIPGFAACVVRNNEIIWSNSYGLADIRHNVPMSIDCIMNIGSVSKTFTAAAAMQLWEKGLLDLDEDVSKYLDFSIRNPKYPDKPITIFQILTHTSSITDGSAYADSYSCGDPTISIYDWIYNYLTPEGKYYSSSENFGVWVPGEKERYSNVAFGLLGLIVERVAGQPFNVYCREHIFRPLGMKNTGWYLSEIDTSHHIKPYAYVTDENMSDLLQNRRLYRGDSEFITGTYAENCLYSFPNYPDGLVRTNIRDLSCYLIAMMNGGEYMGARILKKGTVDKMFSAQLKDDSSRGLCWHSKELETSSGKVLLWGHTGGDPGIATYLFLQPYQRTGVITFQNSEAEGTFSIVRELFLMMK